MPQVDISPSAEQFVSESDYVQLSRLVIEHGWRTDHGRADTVHELYVEEGELTLGAAATPIRGRQAIFEWGRRLVEAPPWHRIRHVCGNMRFVADGPNAAEGTTLLTVFMVEKPGAATTLPWRVGEDHDRFVRTAHGWRLVSRRWIDLFARDLVE